MNFTVPKFADANDIVDRALRAKANDFPMSIANLMPALRWNRSGLEISERRLIKWVKQRAAELDVRLIDEPDAVHRIYGRFSHSS